MHLYKEYYQLKSKRHELTNQLKKLNAICTIRCDASTQASIKEIIESLEHNSIRMYILEKLTAKGFS